MRPIELKAGNVFRIRKARNARKFTVKGIVLKISKENNFDTKNMHPELVGKILVPIESPYNFGQLILDPDDEIYLVR